MNDARRPGARGRPELKQPLLRAAADARARGDRIDFAQADIIKLGSIGRTFDVIEPSGVLHHLADPFAGWRVLVSLLRPGGVMVLGLYSEAARGNVMAARIDRGARLWPSAEDIR